MKKSKHIVISGKVQGVFFRASTRQKAEQIGVNGWVRNTSDGKVEALFEGDEKKVNKLIEWCRHGPNLAEVKEVNIQEKEPTYGYTSFSIKY